jgi:hypothetical protein
MHGLHKIASFLLSEHERVFELPGRGSSTLQNFRMAVNSERIHFDTPCKKNKNDGKTRWMEKNETMRISKCLMASILCCAFWFVAAGIFAGTFGWAYARPPVINTACIQIQLLPNTSSDNAMGYFQNGLECVIRQEIPYACRDYVSTLPECGPVSAAADVRAWRFSSYSFQLLWWCSGGTHPRESHDDQCHQDFLKTEQCKDLECEFRYITCTGFGMPYDWVCNDGHNIFGFYDHPFYDLIMADFNYDGPDNDLLTTVTIPPPPPPT